MARPSSYSDNDFIQMFEQLGPNATARRLHVSRRSIYQRRVRLEEKLGKKIKPPGQPKYERGPDHPGRLTLQVSSGCMLVGSDCHYWPGPQSLMHKAFVKLAKELKPLAVILNGDVLDFGRISRHPPIGWEKLPEVADEIENAKDRLHEIAVAAGKARKIWTLGNHDARFETRLAQINPEYARVHGVHLHDHFPLWEPCWSVWINNNVVVKHRFRGGDHATWNNLLRAGKTMVTGHLHSAQVRPFTDYNGTRYGVDTGCIADSEHHAFVDYTEDNPKNWREAFAVLTFQEGRLLPPQLVTRWDNKRVVFQGEVISV